MTSLEVSVPIPWTSTLKRRTGAPRLLGGLDIFFDFEWHAIFSHDRSVFPNGRSLASLISSECPAGKTPTLLLTIREDVQASIHDTEDRHIVIVPIRDYLTRAGGDAASTYYARLSGTRLTELRTLAETAFTQVELSAFLQTNLDASALRQWAESSSQAREILTGAARSVATGVSDLDWLVQNLASINPAEIDRLVDRIRDIAGEEGLRSVIQAATDSPAGRSLAAGLLGGRLTDRISDVRRHLAEYQTLIARPDVTETDVQAFLERHPWIVGLTYVRARPRVEIPRGELDFVLYRYDGFIDVLELKGPDDQIIVESREGLDRPPSASAYSLGPTLSKALAQAHLYRSLLEDSGALAAQYGLSDTRQARIMIVLGRSSDLSDNGKEILRQLNLSLHRVEVIPYDLLGRRTEGWLQSIEHLLAPFPPPTGALTA